VRWPRCAGGSPGHELIAARRARILPLWDGALAEFTPAELLAAAGVNSSA